MTVWLHRRTLGGTLHYFFTVRLVMRLKSGELPEVSQTEFVTTVVCQMKMVNR